MDIKKKLQDEIAILDHEMRNELPKAILTARAHGDLKENAEFHAAKERQRFVDARLAQLRTRLAELSMVDLTKIPHDRVGLGSSVEVLDLVKDEKMKYKLVPSEDADVAAGRISTASPIGRGLLGKMVGDEVKITIPGGVKQFEIIGLQTIYESEEL